MKAYRSVTQEALTTKDYAGWENILPARASSGTNVNSETSLNLSTVFICVRRTTETLSTLPVHVYRKTDIGREEVNHPVSQLLGVEPNPEMPANVFMEVMQGHLELRGAAYAEIVRDGRGRVVELWPIHPDKITLERTRDGDLIYRYLPTDYPFPSSKILHIRGFGSNGINSYSVISLARESIGLGLAAQEYGARFFGQGTNTGGFIKHPKNLSKEAYQRLRQELNDNYKGLRKAHKLIMLEEGMEYQKVGVTNDDAQFLETRKFQVSEIARWFGLPAHMVGDLERATFSNIEQQSIEAVIYTWRPRVVRWEQEINMKLLKPGEYVKFSLEGLLRGDTKSRFEAYKIASENGWMNADEIRALEDMNPQPDGMGRIFLAPLNMVNKKIYLDANIPTETDGEQNNKNAAYIEKESRSVKEFRSVSDRRYIADKYRGELRSAAKRVVKREIDWLKEELEEKDAEGAKHHIIKKYGSIEEFAKEEFENIFEKSSAELYPVYAAELGKDAAVSEEYKRAVNEYIGLFAHRYMLDDQRALIKTIDAAIEADTDYKEQLQQTTETWQDKNPHRVDQTETPRMRSYFAKAAYISFGVSKIRSVAHGKSCPFCNELDGAVIGVEESFLRKGEEFQPEGAEYPLCPTSDRSHPPYHEGCDCDIVSDS